MRQKLLFNPLFSAFMKILLADNATGYASAVATLTEKADRVQAAVAAYLALGVAAVPTTADLPDLWHEPKLFLERMLTGGQPVTLSGGLAIEPGKVFDLLHKPEGTDVFFVVVNGLRTGEQPPADYLPTFATDEERWTFLNLFSRSASWPNPGIDITDYELRGGVVKVRQAALDSERERFRQYATSPQQKTEWDALQTIAGALEIIRKTGRFGENFEGAEYLKKALVSGGRGDALNPIRPDAAYVLRTH
jgi:hypothetical protein